jgi:hypothetical protein
MIEGGEDPRRSLGQPGGKRRPGRCRAACGAFRHAWALRLLQRPWGEG